MFIKITGFDYPFQFIYTIILRFEQKDLYFSFMHFKMEVIFQI